MRTNTASSQHENGDLRKIKVCVNLPKVGHPTLRKLSTACKGFVKVNLRARLLKVS